VNILNTLLLVVDFAIENLHAHAPYGSELVVLSLSEARSLFEVPN
jgi:hypothetical protein